jgi:hypothetical protein
MQPGGENAGNTGNTKEELESPASGSSSPSRLGPPGWTKTIARAPACGFDWRIPPSSSCLASNPAWPAERSPVGNIYDRDNTCRRRSNSRNQADGKSCIPSGFVWSIQAWLYRWPRRRKTRPRRQWRRLEFQPTCAWSSMGEFTANPMPRVPATRSRASARKWTSCHSRRTRLRLPRSRSASPPKRMVCRVLL